MFKKKLNTKGMPKLKTSKNKEKVSWPPKQNHQPHGLPAGTLTDHHPI
jgi:hypothetical protein